MAIPSETAPADLKHVISGNLTLLMEIYKCKRRQVCSDLDISYTTYCDWINGRTYPRMEALEALAAYYHVEPRDLLSDISSNEVMKQRLAAYASAMKVSHLSTADAYYMSPDSGSSELIDGHLYAHSSPDTAHQSMLLELSSQLLSHIRRNRIPAHVLPGPYEVELPYGDGTVVIPDISVIYDGSMLHDTGCVGTPDVIFEIATRVSYSVDSGIKQRLYEDSGVKEYWLVVPHLRQVFVYRNVRKTGSNLFDRAGGYSFRDYIASDVISGFTVRMSALNPGI